MDPAQLPLPPDGGPVYFETVLSRFPVEPWNTFSNLIFAVIIIVYGGRTQLNFRRHPLLVTALPILCIGFAGGTVFHATRSHVAWLILDYIPIMILCLIASASAWIEYLKSKFLGIVTTLIPILLICILRQNSGFGRGVFIPLTYAILAAGVLAPLVLVCRRDRWHERSLLFGALLLFTIAIAFRTLDHAIGKAYLPMGSHFLWHLLGGASVWMLFEFMYRRRERTLRRRVSVADPERH